MRWEDRDESSYVEDRRSQSPFGRMGMGRGMRLGGLPLGRKGTIILLLIVLGAGFFGYDLTPLLGELGGGSGMISAPQSSSSKSTPAEDKLARFTSVALRTTEDTWSRIFRQAGREYAPTTLVLYSCVTDTACGYGQSAMGPFYCPLDRKVYIDLSFYQDMERKLGGGGDFALGYVLAHEVGHHVQNLMGIGKEVREATEQAGKSKANRLSVMQELQADCFAGVWGHQMEREGILESGDLEEALNTASAIGDDRLQKEATGRVVPDSFTHGSSAQRLRWFKRGFQSGDPGQCNTFKGID